MSYRRTSWWTWSVGRLAKFAQLPPEERGLLVRAWVLFLAADAGLLLLPFTSLLKIGEVASGGRSSAMPSSLSIPRLGRLVDIAGRYVPGRATCLKRALVLSWLLRRRGIASTLRIGVARRDGVLAAHAWLERDGEVVFGHDGCDFAPLFPAGMESRP
jgi:hypothetical protein